MNKYAIFIAPTHTGYSDRVPDVPGCVVAGKTREETLPLMPEAIELHLSSMREDGDFIPRTLGG